MCQGWTAGATRAATTHFLKSRSLTSVQSLSSLHSHATRPKSRKKAVLRGRMSSDATDDDGKTNDSHSAWAEERIETREICGFKQCAVTSSYQGSTKYLVPTLPPLHHCRVEEQLRPGQGPDRVNQEQERPGGAKNGRGPSVGKMGVSGQGQVRARFGETRAKLSRLKAQQGGVHSACD